MSLFSGGAVAQLGARLDGIEEVVGSNPIGSTNFFLSAIFYDMCNRHATFEFLLFINSWRYSFV
jgi:hypothetical protein